MRTSLGIALRADSVAAVAVRDGHIVWRRIEPADAASLGAALERVVAERPRGRRRCRATVAVGPSFVRVKRPAGAPPTMSDEVARALIASNVDTFFAGCAPDVALTVARGSGGALWCAAFDRTVLDEAQRALAGAGVVIRFAAPAASPLARVSNDAQVLDVADAYAMAIARRPPPLAWKPEPDVKSARRRRRTRATMSVAAVVAAGLAALFAPALRQRAFARAAVQDINRLRPAEHEAALLDAELGRSTALLTRVHRLAEERGRATMLLAAITQVLPESTAIAGMRLDSLDGTLTIIGPHAADVLPALASVDRITDVRVAGSVARENVGPARLERAAFRFRLPRPAASSVVPHGSPASSARGRP